MVNSRPRQMSFWVVNGGEDRAVKDQRVYVRTEDGAIVCLDEGSEAPDGYVKTKFAVAEGAAPGHLVRIECAARDLLVSVGG